STLRGRLQSGANAYGIVLSVPSPVTARIASTLGFDWACIDMEHSPQSASIMAEMVAAITSSSSSCTPLVRVPSHSEEWIKWAVDAGAQGIVIPGVQNKDQMWRLVSLCRSATQSLSTPSAAPPLFGHGRHRDSPDAAAVSSPSTAVVSDIMVIPQIESTDAVANIDDILSVHGVDAVFVRPQNLSSGHSPMLPAQMTGGAVSGSLGHVIRAARHFTIPLGIDCADGDAARMRIQQGFQMVVVANDVDILASAATDQLNRARS
ncbi:Phosphoenolpyruvate/pyruvate domain-containing protein, partial [Martensiomyces pterosporus]